MTKSDLESMDIDDLRKYVLNNREDIDAFHVYVDRSKAVGRMIAIDPSDPNWEADIDPKIRQATSRE